MYTNKAIGLPGRNASSRPHVSLDFEKLIADAKTRGDRAEVARLTQLLKRSLEQRLRESTGNGIVTKGAF